MKTLLALALLSAGVSAAPLHRGPAARSTQPPSSTRPSPSAPRSPTVRAWLPALHTILRPRTTQSQLDADAIRFVAGLRERIANLKPESVDVLEALLEDFAKRAATRGYVANSPIFATAADVDPDEHAQFVAWLHDAYAVGLQAALDRAGALAAELPDRAASTAEAVALGQELAALRVLYEPGSEWVVSERIRSAQEALTKAHARWLAGRPRPEGGHGSDAVAPVTAVVAAAAGVAPGAALALAAGTRQTPADRAARARAKNAAALIVRHWRGVNAERLWRPSVVLPDDVALVDLVAALPKSIVAAMREHRYLVFAAAQRDEAAAQAGPGKLLDLASPEGERKMAAVAAERRRRWGNGAAGAGAFAGLAALTFLETSLRALALFDVGSALAGLIVRSRALAILSALNAAVSLVIDRVPVTAGWAALLALLGVGLTVAQVWLLIREIKAGRLGPKAVSR